MTPQDALEAWENYGGAAAMPQIYRDMGLERLRILVAESAKPRPRDPMDRIAPPRLGYNALDRALGRETAVLAATAAATKGLLEMALGNPKRLRTSGRQRASFLYHLKVCGSVEQAAARAGVNRGSLYRWRRQDARFAERWDEAIALRAREIGDDIVLQAAQVQVDPLFYEGKQVGERRRINTRLLMHVQRRMDGERHRAEDRAERRERTALDQTALAERIVVLVSQRLEMSRPASPPATADSDGSSNETRDLKDAA